MSEYVDVIVVGAGPAGLAAGIAAHERGANVLVLERGSTASRRERSQPADLAVGVGGAGLYSDGKFSFAPSATALWTLAPEDALREAYDWTSDQLSTGRVRAPSFDSNKAAQADRHGPLKPYPSQYMPLDARVQLIENLERELEPRLAVRSHAHLMVREDVIEATFADRTVGAQAAVLATGRFGPLWTPQGVERRYQRVEIGMRVEQQADQFVLDIDEFGGLLDPKWIRRSEDGRLEWRTFCCCRRGEVVETAFGGLLTVSGRADGPPTNMSNVGLNVRFLDVSEAERALADMLCAARQRPLRVGTGKLTARPERSQVAERFSPLIANALASGLNALANDAGVDLADAVLHLPAVEGVGYYPAVDETLAAGPGVWVAGDATGLFRGLVPALVSGRMAGVAASSSTAGS